MYNKGYLKRTVSLILCVTVFFSVFFNNTSINAYAKEAAELSDKYSDYSELLSLYSLDEDILSYSQYLSAYSNIFPNEEINIDAENYSLFEGNRESGRPVIENGYEGMEGNSVLLGESDLIEFDFDVEEEGFYDLSFLYYPVSGKSGSIEKAVIVDGTLPYDELSNVEFNRIWKMEISDTYEDENGIVLKSWEKDNRNNHLVPKVYEEGGWLESFLYDSTGLYTDSMKIYFEAGHHTLGIMGIREPMLLRSITLMNREPLKSYREVLDSRGSLAADSTGKNIRLEAENAVRTSSQMLYPKQDQSSPDIYPVSPKLLLNNSIGGESWQSAGQWIEWEFEVDEPGFYNISMFVKQNYIRGIDVYREIYIDGEVPFKEMEAYGFSYKLNWRDEVFSDENNEPYKFYLDKGTHTLRMKVVLGNMAGIIDEVRSSVYQLNNIYRQVIYVTGVTPDIYRDYQLNSTLPELNGDLKSAKETLDRAIAELKKTAGNNSDRLTVLYTMSDQLTELIEDADRFPEVISSYKVNVRALGNWITEALNEPLMIDRINIYSPDTREKAKTAGFLSKLLFELKKLFYSFIIDYNKVGNVADEKDSDVVLTLWVGTGRDQANVIKALIDENFTKETGIYVNVNLVDMNTLLRASLAGEGPDVAIQVANTSGIAGAVLNTGNDTPVNYGLRNAVLDLTKFPDFPEVRERFSESALIPFSFNNATYGLPDTETFPMMFYRKDILKEINLEVPKTWDDVKVAMTVLSKNRMEFGMLPTEQVFAMLLFQNGGEYYTENGDRSCLDSDEAIAAFKEYCEFYTDYKLDKATSVEERFRTGECPIIISDYTTYNNLCVSAPDIKGLWDFTVVPGVRTKDGTINHTTGATGLADIIMSNTKYEEESWEFLKWWTSAETQILYGRRMESLMGPSARVATANLEALDSLAWPVNDLECLKSQLDAVKGIPQVPGGYLSWRNVNNAFYTVTTDASLTGREYNATPREELMDKVIYINDEIDYKRKEFNLKLAEGN